MLLYVLDDLKGSQRKLYVTSCIRMWDIFAFADEDRTPYPSVKEKGGDDPRLDHIGGVCPVGLC